MLPNTSFDGRKFMKFWFPAFIYSGIIFYVSSLPNLKPPVQGINVDKIWHIGEYIPFGFLVARAIFHTKTGIHTGRLIGLSVFLTFLYAISDEWHQSFVPGRFPSLLDILADCLGGWLGSGLLVRWYRWRKN